MATDVHQQQNVPGDGADVTLINDEDLLRRMWQSTDDFGRKKEIRGRMYRLREQRLKEFYTTGEVASDILNSPETRRRNRQEDEIVVRQTYKQGVCCGDGGSENIMEISSSSQDSLTDRMRQRSERYQQVIENERNDRRSSEHVENIMETGTASETINKSNGYALHSQSLADEGFLTMKSKEIRDSESPTREFHDGGSRKDNEQWYEEKTVQYSGNTGDGDVIVEVTTVKTDDAPEGVTVTRYHTDQKSRLPRMVTSSKQAVSSIYSTSGTGSSTSSRSTNVVSTSSSSSHVRRGTDSDGVVIAEISVRDSSGDKKNQDTVTEETSSSRIQETSAKARSDESEKKVEVSIMKELQKLDSFLAENAGSTPVSPCATFDTTRDSNWTVVSSKKQNGSSRDTEEFVFTAGAATDNTDYDNSKVTTVITRELKDNEPQTVSSGVAKSYSVTKHGRIEVKDGGEPEVVEVVNATESTTKWEGKGDAIEITYQQKRISTDVSPTHETFARSLRSSSAYDSSTRSSSKTSLEDSRRCSRGSPERPRSRDSVLTSDTYSKERVSPTRSVKSISSTSTRFSETTRTDRRNLEKDSVRVSPTRSARSSPEKTITRDRTSPTKSPERKIQEVNVRSTSTTKRKLSTTASRSSPKRSATPRASPRASPDRASDRGSPGRRSPHRDTINGYSSSRSPSSSPNRQPAVRDRTSPSRASPQRASPARDSKDGSPVRLSPERKPLNEYPARTSPARTSPDRSAQKTSRLSSGSTSPDRKYLNEYPARSSPTKESPTRKSSRPEVKEGPDKRSPERKPLTEYPSQGTTDKTPSDGNTPSYQKPTRSATERKLSTDSIHRKSITKPTGRDSPSKTTTTKSIDKESPIRSSPERSVPMNPRDGIDDDEINVNEVKEQVDIRATISTKKTKRTRDSSSSSSEEEPEAEGVTRIEDHAVSVVTGQTTVREDYDSCYNTTRVVSNETELKRRTDAVSLDLESTEEHRISDTDKLHTVRDDTSVTNRGSVDISSEHVTTSVIMAGRRSHETSPDRVPVGERYPTSPSRDEPTRGDIPVTEDDSEEPTRSSNFKPEISEQDKPQKAPEDRTSKPAAKQPPERKSSLKQPRTSPERRSPINDTRNTEINVTARTSQTKVEVRKDITRKVSDTKLASKQKEEPKRKTSSTKEVPKPSSVSPERPRKQSSGVAPQKTITKKPVEGKEDEPKTRRPEKKISTLSLKNSPRSSPERQSPRRTTSPSSEKPRNFVSPDRPQERRQSPSQPLKPTIRGHSPSENTTSSRSPSTSPERTRKPTFPSKKQREVNGTSRSPSSSPERAIKPVNAYNKHKNTSESSSSSPDRSRKPSTSPSRSSKPIATQETPRSPSSSPERPRKSLTSLKRPQAPQSSGSSPSTSPERVRKSLTGTDKLLYRKPSRHSPERQTGTMQPLEGSSRSPSSSPERRRPSSDTDRKNKQPERPSYLVSRPDKKKPKSDEPAAAKPSPSTTIGKPSNEKPLRTSPARTPRESPRRQLDNTDDEYTDRSLSASSPETVKTLDLAKPVEFDMEFKQVDEDEEDIIVSEERKSSGVYVHEFSKTDTTYTNEDTDDKPVSLSSITTMNFSNKPSITRLTNVNAMLDKKHNVSMELETTDITDYSVTVQDDVETKQPHVREPKSQTSEEPLKQPKPKATVTTSRVGLARSKFEKSQQKQTETTVGRRTATHTSKIQSPGYSKIPGRREPESTRERTETPTRVTRKPDTQKAPQQRTPSQSSIGRPKATDKQPQKRTPSQSSIGRPKTGDIASPKSRESTPQRIPVKKSPAESSPLSRRPADKPDRYSRTDSNRSLKKDTETRTTVTRVTKQSSRPEMKSPSVRGTVVTQTTRTTRTTPKQPSTTEVTKKPIRGKDDVGKKETVMKPTDITRKVSKTEITLTTLTNTEVNGGLRYSERDDATSSSDESDSPRYYIETDRKSFEGVTIEEIASDDKGIYRDTSDVELTISTEKYDTDSSIDHTVKSRETSPDSMVRHTYKSNINQQFDDVRRYSRDEVVASVDVSENVTSLKTVDTREDEYAVERPERVEEDKPRRFSTEIYVQPAPTAPKLEDDSEDTEPSSLTVADRVTRFTRIPLGKTKVSPKPKAEPEVTDNLDSPSAVKKARSMFETLAKSPSSPKQIDILSRPSIFHARRGLSPSRPQPTYERPTTPMETDDLSDDEIRKISRSSIDRDITSKTTQSSLFASSVETESTRYGEEPEESGRPETPTRPGRKPSQESPRTTSPSTSPKEPETTYHRKPSVESPRHTSPIRCAPKTPKETESPRTTSPTRPDTSYQRKPSIESPRSVSPTRRVESPRHTSPIRCAPKAPKETESPRTSSPTRPDTSYKRKPSVESPRSVSPTRRVSKEAESPVRRPSQESPRTTSPTRSQRKPSQDSPREISPSRAAPNRRPSQESPRTVSPQRTSSSRPVVESPRKPSYESPRLSSPTRTPKEGNWTTRQTPFGPSKVFSNRRPQEEPRRKPSEATPEKTPSPPNKSSTLPRKVSHDKPLSVDENDTPRDTSPARRDKSEPRDTKPTDDVEAKQSSDASRPAPEGRRSSDRTVPTLNRSGSRVEALVNKVEKRATETTTRKTMEESTTSISIEEITDIVLLERMLEAAASYDERRRIRTQIRIVRRDGPRTPIRPSPVATDNIVQPAVKDTKPRSPETPRQETSRKSPTRAPTRSPSRSPTRSPTRVPQPVPVVEPKVSTVDEPEAPTQDAFVRKSSKSELTVELSKAKPASTASPATKAAPVQKKPGSDLPREACPTDSVTSSYGVGPTDENGLPLFGLRALRRKPQNADATKENDVRPQPTAEPERDDTLRDSSGRPLFGLRAITVSGSTKTESTRVERRQEDSPRSPSPGGESPEEVWEEEPEKDIADSPSMIEKTVVLRDLVQKHEQRSRTSFSSQSPSPVQKPRAKLRDSFIFKSQDDTSEQEPSSPLTEDAKIIKERSHSLKAIIQKHESIAYDDEVPGDNRPSRRTNSLDTYKLDSVENSGKSVMALRSAFQTKTKEHISATDNKLQISENIPETDSLASIAAIRRSGLLKPSQDDGMSNSVMKTATVTTETRMTSSRRGNEPEISSVSMKRDVITGETVARSGEEPVTRITRTKYEYNTPENDPAETLTITDVTDLDDSEEKTATRRSSASTKVEVSRSSPERGSNRRSSGLDNRDRSVSPSKTTSETNSKEVSTTTKTASTDSSGFSRVTRGGSVKALSQKFQKAADESANRESFKSRSYPKAGLIFRTSSFKLGKANGECGNCEDDAGSGSKVEKTSVSRTTVSKVDSRTDRNDVRRLSTESKDATRSSELTVSTTSTTVNGTHRKSFLGNDTKVTGVQDIISRMREADNDTREGDNMEDAEARALLNKFLGAQCILQGMDPIMKAQSPALVRQVEQERISLQVSVADGCDQDIENIHDERLLRQLLESSEDYETRRRIRTRIRTIMADQKATVVAGERADGDKTEEVVESSVLQSMQGELLPLIVEQLKTSLDGAAQRHVETVPAVTEQQSRGRSESSEEGMFDSGTESGEDLRQQNNEGEFSTFMEGLKCSIEEAARKRQQNDEVPAADAKVGSDLMTEVHSALSKLQNSLQLAASRGETLDPARSEALLSLVARLQTSLHDVLQPSAPPPSDPPWNEDKAQPETAPIAPPRLRSIRKRQNRYTVGVTQEELADVRRHLQATTGTDYFQSDSKRRDSTESSPGVREHSETPKGTQESAASSNSGAKVPHPLVKQSSMGDLLSPASKAFRPVYFEPLRSPFYVNQFNNTAKPFPQQDGEVTKAPTNDTPNTSQSTSTWNSTNDINKDACLLDIQNEPSPEKDIAPVSKHRKVLQSLSLDSGTKQKVQEEIRTLQGTSRVLNETIISPHSDVLRGHSHPPPVRSTSWTLDDPSQLLFTPAQTVQIAIHKAAIKKQLSHEEEIRSKHSMLVAQPGKSNGMQREEAMCNNAMQDSNQRHEKTSHTSDKKDYGTGRSQSIGHADSFIQAQTNGYCATDQGYSVYETSKPFENDLGKTYHSSDRRNPFESEWNKLPSEDNLYENIVKNNQTESQQNGLLSVVQNTGKTNDYTSNSSTQKFLQQMSHDDSVPSYSSNITREEKLDVGKALKKSDKKKKMKRANTIDIPKPLNFYEVEDEDEYLSDDENEPDSKTAAEKHRAAYLALRGPIRVGTHQQPAPIVPFEPKTESDKKFLAFLEQHSPGDVKPIYHQPSAGGHHWSNRFSNIKTAFESGGPYRPPAQKPTPPSGPAAARMFWRAADDSVTASKSRAAAHGPKLSKQSSTFLRQLFEQKDAQKSGDQARLPWTSDDKNHRHDNVHPPDSVVIGSLRVANSVTSKKQLFTKMSVEPTPPPALIKAPAPVNKFSHAPLSAFQPPEKKSSGSMSPLITVTNPAIGKVKNLVEQRFCDHLPATCSCPPVVPTRTHTNTIAPSRNKNRLSFTPQESTSPLSPTLPWTKDTRDLCIVQSSTAKFETLSRENSPPPIPPQSGGASRGRGRSVDRIIFPNSIPVSSYSSGDNRHSHVRHSPPPVPPPPMHQGAPPVPPPHRVPHSPPPPVPPRAAAGLQEETTLHTAVSRVMTGPVCQQAVVQHREVDSVMRSEGRSSAVRNLSSVLQKFSAAELQPTASQGSTIEKHQQPLLTTSREKLNDEEEVLTTRLQIPIKDQVSRIHRQLRDRHAKEAQQSMNSPTRSKSLHDIINAETYKQQPSPPTQLHGPSKDWRTNIDPSSFSPTRSSSLTNIFTAETAGKTQTVHHSSHNRDNRRSEVPTFSPPRCNSLHDILRAESAKELQIKKSGSCNQIPHTKAKRPQSLALDSITQPAPRRPPASLSKNLRMFPKQFEARMSPENMEKKQREVEAYFNQSSKKPSKPDPITSKPPIKRRPVLDDELPMPSDIDDNVDEAFENLFHAATMAQQRRDTSDSRHHHSSSSSNVQKRQHSASLAHFQHKQQAWEESSAEKRSVAQNLNRQSESMSVSASGESSSRTVTRTEVHSKTSSFSSTTTGKTQVSKVPPSKMMSPFAKFKQLDKQASSSAPNSPKTPGGTGPLFKFTDPGLSRSASSVKDGLLYWCQNRTKDYKNIKIENFSTSWSNGLAFCALIHRFCPDAFDYEALRPEERRKNFELAFRVADEKAGIAPLLDVEDMVEMRKPDWKCVFTYVQSIYRRFKDED